MTRSTHTEQATMLTLTDIKERVWEALSRARAAGTNAELHLTGGQATDRPSVGGLWRGRMTSGPLEMRVLVTVRHVPPPGTPTWYATGVSQQAWGTANYDTSLGPVQIKTHSFNPEGHYYELEGYGEIDQFAGHEVH